MDYEDRYEIRGVLRCQKDDADSEWKGLGRNTGQICGIHMKIITSFKEMNRCLFLMDHTLVFW